MKILLNPGDTLFVELIGAGMTFVVTYDQLYPGRVVVRSEGGVYSKNGRDGFLFDAYLPSSDKLLSPDELWSDANRNKESG